MRQNNTGLLCPCTHTCDSPRGPQSSTWGASGIDMFETWHRVNVEALANARSCYSGSVLGPTGQAAASAFVEVGTTRRALATTVRGRRSKAAVFTAKCGISTHPGNARRIAVRTRGAVVDEQLVLALEIGLAGAGAHDDVHACGVSRHRRLPDCGRGRRDSDWQRGDGGDEKRAVLQDSSLQPAGHMHVHVTDVT